MMTEDEILIEVAKLDDIERKSQGRFGHTNSERFAYYRGNEWVGENLPPYLTSRDAIIPVIAKQDRGTKTALLYWLERDPWSAEKIIDAVLLATPMRLAVALLKAKGRWRE